MQLFYANQNKIKKWTNDFFFNQRKSENVLMWWVSMKWPIGPNIGLLDIAHKCET